MFFSSRRDIRERLVTRRSLDRESLAGLGGGEGTTYTTVLGKGGLEVALLDLERETRDVQVVARVLLGSATLMRSVSRNSRMVNNVPERKETTKKIPSQFLAGSSCRKERQKGQTGHGCRHGGHRGGRRDARHGGRSPCGRASASGCGRARGHRGGARGNGSRRRVAATLSEGKS